MSNEPRHEELDRIMDSLNGIRRAEPSPFFFTRLQARLEKSRGFWENIGFRITRPVIAVPVILAILVINLAFIISGNNAGSVQEETAEEYEFSVATIYEYENGEPNEQ